MGTDLSESRRERSEERRWGDSPLRNSDEYDEDKTKSRGEHRSKDKKRSRREDKEHISRDKERSKSKDGLKDREKDVKDSGKDRTSSKEKKKDRIEDHEKYRTKDKGREKDLDKDKQRGKVHDRDEKDRKRKRDGERDQDNEPEIDLRQDKREKEKEKGREKDKGRDKDKDEGRDREKKEKEKTRERDEERKRDKNKDSLEKEKDKDHIRERKREVDHGKDRSRRSRDDHDSGKDGAKDAKFQEDGDFNRDKDAFTLGKTSPEEEDAALMKLGDYVENPSGTQIQSRKDIEERILKSKEDRLKRKSEGGSEILSWVNRSRKLEEKRTSEKQKAKQRSKMLDEQDDVYDDDDDDEGYTRSKGATDALAGVKVLHGVDKVLEGGSVVLTIKDQEILDGDDVNESMDVLENVEIGEQKRRNEAYKAGKKTTGMYDDKFNDQPGEVKKMLPQYDDPAEEEGTTLDAGGRFTANEKIEELRRKLQIPSHNNQVEDLNTSVRISSDYYTPEEMLRFKKPKKKKSLRKKEKLDIDALEAEARAEGLGASDLRSRNDSRTQIAKEEEEKAEAKRRSNAYQTAVARADEASKALRLEQTLPTLKEEDDADVFDADAEDLQKSLARARKLALKKQSEKPLIGPEAIARLAKSIVSSESLDAQNSTSGDASENKVVFTEMEEFVWGLQHDEDAQRSNHEDVFMEEDETPTVREEKMDVDDGWTAVSESEIGETSMAEVKEEIIPDNTIHEVAVGKGLGSVLKLFKERGALAETIEYGGRNMDKKKSKLVGIHDDDGNPGTKEINLDRRDEFGRILPPKEAFRLLSHVFHGKGPGKKKEEKRIKQYHDEQKLKKMTSSDVLPQSVERMREAQLQTQSPYVVLSGHVKTGQSSGQRSGFATVEKEVPGSLTPMLGDEKVEHFLGIKRKPNAGGSRPPRKP